MVKSAPSCFRIIGCVGDSVDRDDLQTPESKASSDRRGWSFRKRSARHRVLSNTVTSESPASGSKESQESISVNCQVHHDLTVTEKTTEVQQKEEKTTGVPQKEEKTSEVQQKEEKITETQLNEEKTIGIPQKEVKTTEVQQQEEKTTDSLQKEEKTTEIQPKEEKITEFQQNEEKTELSSLLDSKLSGAQASGADDLGADAPYDESSIILVQAAARGFLARRLLLKHKSITKLQAVVRGHIVRSHAIGTLRCVQAIVKMQALVRARHAHLQFKKDGTHLSKREAKASPAYTYISIEKLLSNAFARQLMEASPRNKPINIKCDPSKSDSAWKWLERWMSVSSVSDEEPHEAEAVVEQHKDSLGHSAHNEEDLSVQIISKPTDSESGFYSSDDVPNDNNKTKYDANNLDVHSRKCEIKESAPTEIKYTELVEVMEQEYLPKKEESQNKEPVLHEVVEVEHLPEKEETEVVQEGPDSEEFSSMQPETEVKKISRKASNPAFIAAQSKFEELSLVATSAKLSTSPTHDPDVESSLNKAPSANQDQPFRSEDKDSRLAGNSIPSAAVHIGSSECGTELSISSTLDSPDRSGEAGVNDSVMETKASDETNHPRNGENLEVEAKSIVLQTDPSSNNTTKLERNESVDSVSGESLHSSIPADTPQLNKPADLSHIQVEQGSETNHPEHKLSPKASPKNHAAIPEFLTTPSSKVSDKPKKSKGAKSRSNGKSKPSSDDKGLSTRTPDSASRSNLEHLPEHKLGKRRDSFGSAKPDHKELEPRDSSSSNSLPSYMQATESAKAKAIANGSPRSSPDVHDKDIYIKKRHSLPGTNERQGSPRIHRSLSQAQHSAKGNASHSPQDRKWRR